MQSTAPAGQDEGAPEFEEEGEGPSGPWPRSSALLVVLIIGFVFGALSFLPLVGAVLFYGPSTLATSSDFIRRSAVGDSLQILYQLLLLELGYLLGKRVAFERDYLWLLIPAYFGAVLGYLIGIPGLQTTTVSGGIFLFQTNPLDPTHMESAFFNSPTLMGMLVSGMGLAFVAERRSSAAQMPDAEELTSTGALLVLFLVAAAFSFIAYMMPPIFYVVFKAAVGAAAATSGTLYAITTNSNVLANPLLFFLLLFLLGGRVRIFRDSTTVIIMLFIAVVVGAIAGNPVGSYVTSYVASGSGTIPNYLANVNILTTFLASVVAVSFAGTFLGFSAVSESTTRQMVKSGSVPPPPPPQAQEEQQQEDQEPPAPEQEGAPA